MKLCRLPRVPRRERAPPSVPPSARFARRHGCTSAFGMGVLLPALTAADARQLPFQCLTSARPLLETAPRPTPNDATFISSDINGRWQDANSRTHAFRFAFSIRQICWLPLGVLRTLASRAWCSVNAAIFPRGCGPFTRPDLADRELWRLQVGLPAWVCGAPRARPWFWGAPAPVGPGHEAGQCGVHPAGLARGPGGRLARVKH